ncbi:MBL fold metallo-hydrolase [Plantactinospora endophytica]|uniref:MBL fold metallo-hydrolase n=1 Tax=Plantactinospora endophytica TaxID=673535 RepID=A0ABQ4E363_9ACTN|nr:MBL fold metallo-hydrolase [Plantactinospora endophytica]GIG89138.1 MBL fold metallo-hydrolase [Plantactinospora endophytica]
MRMIKYTHSCVRLEADGRSLVIDPGTWTEAEALDSVDHVLVTHEHPDHLDVERVSAAVAGNPALRVYAHADVAAKLKDLGPAVVPVASGDEFEAGGFPVRAVGRDHAEIYQGLPGIPNLGFVVDVGGAGGGLYHPGDAFFVPDLPVATLLVPSSAPWLKISEALDFVRAVKPRRAYSIHDAIVSERGAPIVDRWFEQKAETEYARITPGQSVTFD